MTMTVFWVGGLSRHSDEHSICPFKRTAARKINKKMERSGEGSVVRGLGRLRML